MICPKCKITIEDDSFFCKHCGARLAAGSGPAAPAPPQTPATAEPPLAGQAATGATAPVEDVYRDPKFEKDIWQGRPAWRSYYGAWALWAVVSAVILGSVLKWQGEHRLGTWVALLVAAAAIVIFVHEAFVVFSLSYRLTTQRLFVRRGILGRVTDQMELVRVDDVRVRQGLIDRLVNTGTVEVISSDPTDQDLSMDSISAPHDVAESLRRHVRGSRSKGTVFVEQV